MLSTDDTSNYFAVIIVAVSDQPDAELKNMDDSTTETSSQKSIPVEQIIKQVGKLT